MIFYCLSYHKLITLQSSNGQREVNYRQFNPFAQPSQEGWRAQIVILKVEIEENTVATVISLHPYSFTHSTSYSPYLSSQNAVSWTMGEMLAGAWDSPSGYKGRNWERTFFFKNITGLFFDQFPTAVPFLWVRTNSVSKSCFKAFQKLPNWGGNGNNFPFHHIRVSWINIPIKRLHDGELPHYC